MGLFGPSKKEIWQQLAEEIQGDYVNKGCLIRDSSVRTFQKE